MRRTRGTRSRRKRKSHSPLRHRAPTRQNTNQRNATSFRPLSRNRRPEGNQSQFRRCGRIRPGAVASPPCRLASQKGPNEQPLRQRMASSDLGIGLPVPRSPFHAGRWRNGGAARAPAAAGAQSAVGRAQSKGSVRLSGAVPKGPCGTRRHRRLYPNSGHGGRECQ